MSGVKSLSHGRGHPSSGVRHGLQHTPASTAPARPRPIPPPSDSPERPPTPSSSSISTDEDVPQRRPVTPERPCQPAHMIVPVQSCSPPTSGPLKLQHDLTRSPPRTRTPLDTPPITAPKLPDLPTSETMDSLSSLEADFTDILAGYDNPQPSRDDEPVSAYSRVDTRPADCSPQSLPMTPVRESAPPPPAKSPPTQKSSPSRFFHIRSHTNSTIPASSHKRTGSTSYFSSDPSFPSKPARRPTSPNKDGAETPLSPTKWRKEFMANSMLRPATNVGGAQQSK